MFVLKMARCCERGKSDEGLGKRVVVMLEFVGFECLIMEAGDVDEMKRRFAAEKAMVCTKTKAFSPLCVVCISQWHSLAICPF